MPYEQLFHIYSVFIRFVVFLLICDLDKTLHRFYRQTRGDIKGIPTLIV